MGKIRSQVRTMSWEAAALFLCGGALAMPSAAIDFMLADWSWTPARFGWGVLFQGVAAFAGTRMVAKSSAIEHFLQTRGLLRLHSLQKLMPVFGSAAGLGGMASLYVLALPWLGFLLTGLAVGIYTTLGNRSAAQKHASPRGMTFLNMMFTLGALASPTLVVVLLPLHSASSPSYPSLPESWRAVPLVLGVGISALFWMIQIADGHQSRNTTASARPLAKAIQATEGRGVTNIWTRLRSPYVCASIGLFCYVGTEINLSNGWMLFLRDYAQLPAADARLSGTFFWGGLFAARAWFTLFHPRTAALQSWLKFMGLCSVILISLALASQSWSNSGQVAAPSVPAQWLAALLQPPQALMLLAICAAIGMSIGAVYGFVLGALTIGARNGGEAARDVASVMQWGVLGAIILPPTMGTFADSLGQGAAMAFVLFAQIVFVCAMFLWRNPQGHKTRVTA
jgi:fucose permease